MREKEILGRKQEKELLRDLYESKKPEFLALYGRRRVGKTYLVKTFFTNLSCPFLYVTGMKDGTLKEQLSNFAESFSEGVLNGVEIKPPSSWMEAFKIITRWVNNLDPKKKFVLFLDELPWLASKRSACLQALDYYWNRYWSHDTRFKLIVCGSAASWIIKNIIQNKGGLYNRITRQSRLEPLSLEETSDFLQNRGIRLNKHQILEIYMAMGGIPFYLDQIEKGKSATQNISSLAFSKKGLLYQDFEIVFRSLFENADIYQEIIEVLAKYRYGIEQSLLFEKCKILPKGGSSIKKLQDLEQAGFIISFLPYGNAKRGTYYRIIDEYANFYCKWIQPLKKSAQKLSNAEKYWLSKRNSPSWQAWSGYAFETICYKHVSKIQEALNIDPASLVATWRHDGKKGDAGAQIDLLFDRPDDSITICEIKHTEQPFKLDKAVYQEISKKIEVYQRVSKTKKTIFLAMIASSGLQHTVYSEEYVSAVATLDDLF